MRTAANLDLHGLGRPWEEPADTIHNRTHCIGINMDELRKPDEGGRRNETVDDKRAE